MAKGNVAESLDIPALEGLFQEILTPLGVELLLLEEVVVFGQRTLRTYLDSPNGILVEHCTRAAKALMADPRVESAISDSVDLEVSSPGVERPLRTLAHFSSYLGKRVLVRFKKKRDGQRKITGELLSATEDGVTVSVDGKQVLIPMSEIARACLKPSTAELFAAS